MVSVFKESSPCPSRNYFLCFIEAVPKFLAEGHIVAFPNLVAHIAEEPIFLAFKSILSSSKTLELRHYAEFLLVNLSGHCEGELFPRYIFLRRSLFFFLNIFIFGDATREKICLEILVFCITLSSCIIFGSCLEIDAFGLPASSCAAAAIPSGSISSKTLLFPLLFVSDLLPIS